MEPELLHLIIAFVAGLTVGALLMLLWNKLSSGSASPAGLKQEYQEYQGKVEEHFEQTSKKFQDMTEQYQDLYQHLSVGATSLCRPDSVAAGLADESSASLKLEKPEVVDEQPKATEEVSDEAVAETGADIKTDAEASAETDEKPEEVPTDTADAEDVSGEKKD